MRAASRFASFAMMGCLAAGRVAAQTGDGRIGIYADLSATQTSAIFSVGVPRTLYVIARLEGRSAGGITGAEFRIDGLPEDWIAVVTPNPAANVNLGNPFRASNGLHRANLAFPSCTSNSGGRLLLYTTVVVPTTAVEPLVLGVATASPPTNPGYTTPVLLLCDAPDFSPVAAEGESFRVDVRGPHDLDYPLQPGYEGARGAEPERGLPGDLFHFRVVYTSADGLPPAGGSPRLELDADGDGDPTGPGEGRFTMSPADHDSTLANGKEYRFDVALGAPPLGLYRYRFTAIDAQGDSVPGTAAGWRDSLFVSADLADIAVRAEDIRIVPPDPQAEATTAIVARIENRSERRVEGVSVRIEDVFGQPIATRTLASMGARSATEVACTWRFRDGGVQPVVVRVGLPGGQAERDPSNDAASHAVQVGGLGVSGRISIGGLPPQITVPPASPFGLAGSAEYSGSAFPNSPVRGARVVWSPSWEAPRQTRTSATGAFRASFVTPAAPGSYRLALVVTDGARTDSTSATVLVVPFAAGLPPHGPDLEMHLEAALGAGCPAAEAAIAWSVTNRGDRTSESTSARLLAGGTSLLAEVPLAALAPGASAVLDAVMAPLAGSGLHVFTAHADPGSLVRELREDDNVATAGVRVAVDCLDLSLDGMRFVTTRFCTDATVAFAVQVANRGCVASEPARVACRADGAEIASAPLAALAPGESAELGLSADFATAFCRDLDIRLDPEGAAGADCDRTNNAVAAGVCIGVCDPPPPSRRPNFHVEACGLRAANAHPAAGESVGFLAWVENRGTGDATDSVLVRFDVDGVVLGAAVAVQPLPAGGRALVASAATWPVDFTPHVVAVRVDPNGQPESNDLDNVTSRPLPWELRPKPLGRCPPAAPPMFSECAPCTGVPFDVRAVVVNDGLFDCDSVRVDFRDEGAGGAVLRSVVARDVRAGGECEAPLEPVAASVTLTATGWHRIAAVLDPENVLPELDEANNVHTQDVVVGCSAAPDLVAAVRLPPGWSPQPGDTVRAVEVTVTNRGYAAAFDVRARLRLDGGTLCDFAMGSLGSQESRTQICTTPWVVSTSTCAQRLEACADPEGRVGESNESNNCTTTGVGPGPETDLALYAYSIRATPTNPHAGEEVLIEVGIYSHRGVESACNLNVEWRPFDAGWQPLGTVPLTLPAGISYFPTAASFVWTVPLDQVALHFEIRDVCPADAEPSNNEAYGTLPWYVAPGTPVVVSDLEAASTPDAVVVRWRAEPPDAVFALERRTADDSTWEPLPPPVRAGGGADFTLWEAVDRDAVPGARLEYRILGRLEGGAFEVLGSVSVVHAAARVERLQLAAVRPNPFRPGGHFELTLPEERVVELGVYDAAGRRVALLWHGPRSAGRHTVPWDGRDATGGRVPSGVYFCRLAAGSFHATRRFVLLH